MLNEDLLWRAVSARDSHWDGAFVYAVPSTRIYCRPTCPSRRPGRPGVRFFAAPAAAEAAGFRPCRRCNPSAERALPQPVERVRRVCAVIAARPDARVTLPALARAVRVGPHHLLRTFKQVLGISPREYADACRLGCLKAGLRAGQGVAAATYAAGYGSGSRVYERAASTLGMTPGAYASGGKGADVQYMVAESPLGQILVAATSRGVCSVKLGADRRALEAELHREYPAASITPGTAELRGWVSAIVASLSPGAPDARLPLDVRTTAFQQLVWRELQRIPRGATRSYSDIARRIGRPSAARAVARACATNPTALIVPCHRVVRDDGQVGGYRWGIQQKRALLDAERTAK